MIFIVDNYDSFTYNLVHHIGEFGEEIEVYRNDDISLDSIENLKPSHIIISPGPKTPKESGISVELIRHFAGRIPILGVCLGYQCIAYSFGGRVIRANRLMHGKTSQISHDGKKIFSGIKNPFTATRYHSLIVDESTLPECFEKTALSEQNELMAIRHREKNIEGVQFHPESFLTIEGRKILKNFIFGANDD